MRKPEPTPMVIAEAPELLEELIELLWEHVAEAGSYDRETKTWCSNARSGVVNYMLRLIELGEAEEVGQRYGRVMRIRALED